MSRFTFGMFKEIFGRRSIFGLDAEKIKFCFNLEMLF